jgi:hypothetical protein
MVTNVHWMLTSNDKTKVQQINISYKQESEYKIAT